MIGQYKIREYVEKHSGSSFPHFLCLVGDEGMGKRTLAKEIANIMGMHYCECDIKVDTVREVSNETPSEPTLYCFANADNMSDSAIGALLKLTEEPFKRTYICLTITDRQKLPETLKSRGYIWKMEGYTAKQLSAYIEWKCYGLDIELIKQLATTPHEVDILKTYNLTEFYDYVKLVLDNIATVEPSNAFKSANKLAIVSESGYDLRLFFKCINHLLYEKVVDEIGYASSIIVTSQSISKLGKLGANKSQIYDEWVLNIRRTLSEFN